MVDAVAELERGRESYTQRAWRRAYDSLSAADQASPLGPEDLESLATSAYMLGRDGDYVSALERAHHAYLDADEPSRGARCAFWVGLNLLLRGETARANGWFARGERLLDRAGRDCVERGYMLIPAVLDHVARGDSEAAYATAAEAAAVGERFGDADLVALVVQEQGHALLRQGRREEGLGLLDEVMVEVTMGDLSPIVTGLIYCNTIAFCQGVYELRRAREWTRALTRWCEQQPDMVAHTGVCLVHRAEIMELAGAWPEAFEEARRARERFAHETLDELGAGHACYRQAEVHRLRGEFARAEEAYREATRCGWEPQPGIALLWLARGRGDAAAGAIRRTLGETSEPLKRLRLLPAYVEIMLAVDEIEQAREACRELEEISESHRSSVVDAITAYARGAVELAEGDPERGLMALRRSLRNWQQLDVPYEAARARLLVGLACRALGDEATSALELDAARTAFAELGAAPDLARLESLAPGGAPTGARGLTDRALEVLRLVATGQSNREIASGLVISEHTVARHLQNIFAKLNVSSRTAASAFAFEHDLV
jgi:DNA-binding NarL/FixJ family response regulator